MDCLDNEAEFIRDHAKKEHYALLIDGGVSQAAKVDWCIVHWPIDFVLGRRSGRFDVVDYNRRCRNFVARLNVKLLKKRRLGFCFFQPVPIGGQCTLQPAEATTHNVCRNFRLVGE